MVGKPQKNTVTLTYSNNPHGNGIGTTVEHSAYDYTYGIDVTKVGSDDENKGLAGVSSRCRSRAMMVTISRRMVPRRLIASRPS